MKKILIPQDKANHFVYGFMIFVLASIFFKPLICLIIVIFVSASKEIYDKLFKKGTPEILDFVATIIPGLILYFLKYI